MLDLQLPNELKFMQSQDLGRLKVFISGISTATGLFYSGFSFFLYSQHVIYIAIPL